MSQLQYHSSYREMNLASYYLTLLILETLANLSTVISDAKFNVFWNLRSSSNECQFEEVLLGNLQKHPENCFQTKLNSSDRLSIQACVENIKCENKRLKINYDLVSMCTTEIEMVCCLNKKDCQDKQNNLQHFRQHHLEKEVDDHCKTVRKFEKNSPKCSFPFKYQGENYHSCTVATDRQCLRWCATLTDSNNLYLENSHLWGYCNNICPINYTETCVVSNKVPRFKKELEKDPKLWTPSSKTCGTQNTTTTVKSKDGGSDEKFTLVNPGKCSFPFNYRDVWYSTCIAKDDPVCRLWCSVRNDSGYHRKLGSKWAYCDGNCPKNSRELCTVRGKKMVPHFFMDEFPTFDYVESEDPNFTFDYDED